MTVSQPDLFIGPKLFREYTGEHRVFFAQYYFVMYEKGKEDLLALDPAEISEVRWWTQSEIIESVSEGNGAQFASALSDPEKRNQVFGALNAISWK